MGLTLLPLFLMACTSEEEVTAPLRIAPSTNLPSYFDCLDAEGKTLVSAHRGGRDKGYPENNLATFQRTVREVTPLLEIDIRTSADGILFLHHDDRLGRTTTGAGNASETKWETLRTLSLKDKNGDVTAYGLTTLEEALIWAEGQAILQLDIKWGTDYDDVARIVKRVGAEGWVIPIAYTEGQVLALNSRFPNSMLSVPMETIDNLDQLIEKGVEPHRLLAWTGNKVPNPQLYEQLDAQDVEVIFGTLGGRSSIDKELAASGNDQKYADLAHMGVDILATDRPQTAQKILQSNDLAVSPTLCQ
ncbi:MAG: glycerophosphodiester phosphodiesterase family protein [Pseudomonadota bacterium]